MMKLQEFISKQKQAKAVFGSDKMEQLSYSFLSSVSAITESRALTEKFMSKRKANFVLCPLFYITDKGKLKYYFVLYSKGKAYYFPVKYKAGQICIHTKIDGYAFCQNHSEKEELLFVQEGNRIFPLFVSAVKRNKEIKRERKLRQLGNLVQ